ncbi:hypothetical protein M0R45_027240 [Rubus argutus]|uniref:Uncharacterized protein n=1 Tax=Rubus argutus TaxID=59490 RepID=A0AAW1X2G6_RUBAR
MIFFLRSKLFSKIWQLTNVPCGSLELAAKVCNGAGSNKGIGLETVRPLTSNLLLDMRRGPNLLHTSIVFHVTDPARFAEFIKIQFGKLDILV